MRRFRPILCGLAVVLGASLPAPAQLALGGGFKLQGELPHLVLTLRNDTTVAELAWARGRGRLQAPGLTLDTRAALFTALIRLHLPLPAPATAFVALGGISTYTAAVGAYRGEPLSVGVQQEGVQAAAGVEFGAAAAPWRAYGGAVYTLLPLETLYLRSADGRALDLELAVPGVAEWGWQLGLRLDFSLAPLLGA